MKETQFKNNGYEILRCKSLQELKLKLKEMDVDETYFIDIKNIITNYINH